MELKKDIDNLIEFLKGIPKAELHIHLEGSIEPETQLLIAERNKIKLKYSNLEDIKKAYKFKDLNDFLQIYNQGTKILKTEEDFYDITIQYLKKARSQNILHTEIFIDFQTYTKRNISPDIIMNGIKQAIKDSKPEGISTYIILAFLRHLGANAAMKTYELGLKYRDDITGIGLAAAEIGYPPELFVEVYKRARSDGYHTTAHAGEEGPASYVRECVELLKVERIDHGIKAMDDPDLIEVLKEKQIPLTLCPLSNTALGNVKSMKDHTLKKKLDFGLMVSINSDDPAFFNGYVIENMIAVVEELDLDAQDIEKLARNSIVSSFLPEYEKNILLNKINQYVNNFKFQ